MNYLLTIQILLFILYIGYITRKFGVLYSISDSFYQFGRFRSPWFTLFSFALGFTTVGYTVFTENVLFFLSGAGFVFLGAAASFREWNVTRYVHYVGALVGVFLFLIAIGVEFGIWGSLVGFIYLTLVVLMTDSSNKIWWIEIIAFLMIISGMYFGIN